MSAKESIEGEENWQSAGAGKPGGSVETDGKGRIVRRDEAEHASEGTNENSATSSSSSTSPSTPAIDRPGKAPSK